FYQEKEGSENPQIDAYDTAGTHYWHADAENPYRLTPDAAGGAFRLNYADEPLQRLSPTGSVVWEWEPLEDSVTHDAAPDGNGGAYVSNAKAGSAPSIYHLNASGEATLVATLTPA